jgi:hypothetical protein
MGGINFVTPEEAKQSSTIKALYSAVIILNLVNILLDSILVKATITNCSQ